MWQNNPRQLKSILTKRVKTFINVANVVGIQTAYKIVYLSERQLVYIESRIQAGTQGGC